MSSVNATPPDDAEGLAEGFSLRWGRNVSSAEPAGLLNTDKFT